jgi:hypothetical protein
MQEPQVLLLLETLIGDKIKMSLFSCNAFQADNTLIRAKMQLEFIKELKHM